MIQLGRDTFRNSADVNFCRLLIFAAVFALEPLKRQIKIAADDILILYFYLLKKIRLDFSCEFSA